LIEHIATHIFYHLDEFLLLRLTDKNNPGIIKKDNENYLFRLKARDKGRKLTLSETTCLLFLFQISTCRCFKTFLLISRPWLIKLFPSLPSYSTLTEWISRTEPFLVDYLSTLMAEPGGRESFYMIDSTKIDPHKLKNNPKCMRSEARIGHSHEGMWLGWKLHVLTNRQGAVVAWDLTGANVHDLAPVKGGLLAGVSGTCLADSGYVGEQVRQDLKNQDMNFKAKPTKAMVDLRWEFDRYWKHTYRQRQVVEGVFSSLKSCLGLVGATARSPASARCRALAALALYCMQNWAS
jgi:transposase